jgi:light-harvesting complex I chlorophyll a/b binding protein 5
MQVLRTTGLKDLPVWYEAGASKIEWADTQSLFFVQLILMG